jgi:hypothetical protein
VQPSASKGASNSSGGPSVARDAFGERLVIADQECRLADVGLTLHRSLSTKGLDAVRVPQVTKDVVGHVLETFEAAKSCATSHGGFIHRVRK